MAFVLDPLNDEDEQKKQAQNGGQVIGGSEGGFIPTGGQSAPTAEGGEQRASGSWTNLQNYITANKGNDGAMAGQIRGSVDAKANTLNTEQDGYKSGAETQIKSNTVAQDGNVLNAIKNAPQDVNKDKFKAQYNADYKGPANAANYNQEQYGKIGAQSANLQNLAKNADSDQGKKALIADTYARPSYTQGEKNLDAFVLGSGQAGVEGVQDLQADYKDYGNRWAGITGLLDSGAQQAKTTTDATRQATRTAYDGEVGRIEGNIGKTQQALTAKNAELDTQATGLKEALQSADPNLRSYAYQRLGMNPQEGEWLRSQGYDVTRGIVKDTKRMSLGDMISDGGQNKYNALLGLNDTANTKFDFTKAGGTYTPYDVNSEQIAAGSEAYGLNKSLASRLTKKQAERAAQQSGIANSIKNDGYDALGKKLGLSKSQVTDLSQLADGRGVLKQAYSQGRALNAGDVATDSDRGNWANLVKSLGIGGGLDLNDSGDEGQAYSLNKSLIDAKIAENKANIAATEESGASKGYVDQYGDMRDGTGKLIAKAGTF